jgi:hypothetical protein
MKTLLLSLVVVSAWLIATAPAQAAEPLWLCHQQDGSAIYTTDPSALKDCKQYTSPSGITQAPEREKDGPSTKDQPGKSYEKTPARERRSEDKPKPKGELEFEKFRMLSTGMTEAEILTRAGNPKHVFRFGRNVEHWVYTTEDEWLIEITFTSGRVANIDWYRPRP